MRKLIADAIIMNQGRILLVQQRKQSAYGLWSLPGGGVEENETSEQAVVREISEELGVSLKDYKPFKVYDVKTTDQELEFHTFIGHFNGTVTLQEDELLAYGWFSLESLETMQDKLRTNTLNQARGAFRSL